jgi:ankyrin repeat protein
MLNHFYDESEKEITNNLYTRFLLAQLLMDSFRDKLTVRDVKSALQNLLQGSDAYDVAYHAAMERIFAQGEVAREMAKRILAWILCAHRPLSTLELLHALAIEPGDTEINEDNIMDPEQLLTICAGLVAIDEQSDSIRFIHHTTQEYLQRNQQTWLPHANIEIARTCTNYLLIKALITGPCSSRKDYDRRIETLPLLSYAAVHWGPHMKLVVGESRVNGLTEIGIDALAFLANVGNLSSASQVLLMSDREQHFEENIAWEGARFTGSHWIGRFGLVFILEQWIAKDVELDGCDYNGQSPLCWAAMNGHDATLKALLATDKVNVNSKDKDGRSPLSWAARKGHVAIIERLLETGKVNIDSQDDDGRTALSWAAENGYEAMTRSLLDAGKVDVDSKDKYCQTPLLWAVGEGHEVIVQMLLVTGKINLDSRDHEGRSALSWAAENGYEAVTRLILETGRVDVDSKDKFNRTPLSWAARRGHVAITKLLLDTGKVDIDSQDDDGRTPLSWAAENEHEVVVELLLDIGRVEVDSEDKEYGMTSLSQATHIGHAKIPVYGTNRDAFQTATFQQKTRQRLGTFERRTGVTLSQNLTSAQDPHVKFRKQDIAAHQSLLSANGSHERPYTEFTLHPPKFFRVGRVFLSLWAEPAWRTGTVVSNSAECVPKRTGYLTFSKIRRFVVVREGLHSCSALPITTYGGRGVPKQNVVKSDHAIIYTSKAAPLTRKTELPGPGEAPMRRIPIRVDLDHATEQLDVLSRINLAKIYAIEHNFKTKSCGFVNKDFLEALRQQFEDVWRARMAS